MTREAGRTVRPLIGGKATEIVPGEVDVVAFTERWLLRASRFGMSASLSMARADGPQVTVWRVGCGRPGPRSGLVAVAG